MTWPTDEQVEKAAEAVTLAIDAGGAKEIDVARAALSAVNPFERVRFPQSVDEAAAMAILGTNYLEQHAPERLRHSPSPEGDK